MRSHKGRLNILYMSDDRYGPVLGVSLYSLLYNNSQHDLRIIIIDCGISENSKNIIHGLINQFLDKGCTIACEFRTIYVPKETADIFCSYSGFRNNKMSWLKFFAIDELEDMNRIVFIDCDTIIQGDLMPLMSIDINDQPLAMGLDALNHLPYLTRKYPGIISKDYVYNSGVILFDVNKWQSMKCSELLTKIESKYQGMFTTIDQEQANIALDGMIHTLPCSYNMQPHYYAYSYRVLKDVFSYPKSFYTGRQLQRGIECPGIIHTYRYLGEYPWNSDIHPNRDIYHKYMVLSGMESLDFPESKTSIIFSLERLLNKICTPRLFLSLFKVVFEYSCRRDFNNSIIKHNKEN